MKVSYDKVIDVVLCRGSLGTVKFIGRQSTKCFISLAMFAVACEASQVDGLRLVDYPQFLERDLLDFMSKANPEWVEESISVGGTEILFPSLDLKQNALHVERMRIAGIYSRAGIL